MWKTGLVAVAILSGCGPRLSPGGETTTEPTTAPEPWERRYKAELATSTQLRRQLKLAMSGLTASKEALDQANGLVSSLRSKLATCEGVSDRLAKRANECETEASDPPSTSITSLSPPMNCSKYHGDALLRCISGKSQVETQRNGKFWCTWSLPGGACYTTQAHCEKVARTASYTETECRAQLHASCFSFDDAMEGGRQQVCTSGTAQCRKERKRWLRTKDPDRSNFSKCTTRSIES